MVALLALTVVSCSEPLTTRETGAAIGTVGGAAVGGALGLGAGALIGDRLQAVEKKQTELDKQIEANQRELEQLRKENKER